MRDLEVLLYLGRIDEGFVDAEAKVIWLDQPKSGDVLSLDRGTEVRSETSREKYRQAIHIGRDSFPTQCKPKDCSILQK